MREMDKSRVILHADLDAFFASVEQMDDQRLRGKPVLVGGRPDQRGVVAACSYEARGFGVHSAMSMRMALSRCPSAVILPPRFDRYRELSGKVMAILRGLSPVLQAVSIDEAYLDISDLVADETEAVGLARVIKDRVRKDVGLTISLGVGCSKSVAKIASDMDKPDGLTVVKRGTAETFLSPLPVRKLGGIGPKTERRMNEKGVRTLGQLAAKSDRWLEREFGKRGPELGRMARGEDDRPVTVERVVKSISAETTFPQDVGDAGTLATTLARLSRRVGIRVEKSGRQGRTITVKFRRPDFTTFTRSVTVSSAVRDVTHLTELVQLVLGQETGPGRRFRLLGVGISNFEEEGQLALF